MKSGFYLAITVGVVVVCCLKTPPTTTVVSDNQLAALRGGTLCYSMLAGDECEEDPGGCGTHECVGPVGEKRCPDKTTGAEQYDDVYTTCQPDQEGNDESDAGDPSSHTCFITRFCRADNCVPDTNDKYWCSPLPSGTGQDPVESNVPVKTCKDLDEECENSHGT